MVYLYWKTEFFFVHNNLLRQYSVITYCKMLMHKINGDGNRIL